MQQPLSDTAVIDDAALLLTAEQAAEHLGLRPGFLRAEAKLGGVPVMWQPDERGRPVPWFRRDELDAWWAEITSLDEELARWQPRWTARDHRVFDALCWRDAAAHTIARGRAGGRPAVDALRPLRAQRARRPARRARPPAAAGDDPDPDHLAAAAEAAA